MPNARIGYYESPFSPVGPFAPSAPPESPLPGRARTHLAAGVVDLKNAPTTRAPAQNVPRESMAGKRQAPQPPGPTPRTQSQAANNVTHVSDRSDSEVEEVYLPRASSRYSPDRAGRGLFMVDPIDVPTGGQSINIGASTCRFADGSYVERGPVQITPNSIVIGGSTMIAGRGGNDMYCGGVSIGGGRLRMGGVMTGPSWTGGPTQLTPFGVSIEAPNQFVDRSNAGRNASRNVTREMEALVAELRQLNDSLENMRS